jgi:hypothetical protein
VRRGDQYGGGDEEQEDVLDHGCVF